MTGFVANSGGDDSMKPAAIKKFDWLYLGSIVVGLIGFGATGLTGNATGELLQPPRLGQVAAQLPVKAERVEPVEP